MCLCYIHQLRSPIISINLNIYIYIYIYIHYIVNNSWKEQRPVACLQSFSEPGTDARPPGPERVAPVAPLTQPGGIS